MPVPLPPGSDRGYRWKEPTWKSQAIDAEIALLRDAGLSFRSDVVAGPVGRQILLTDPTGNLIGLFQPAHDPGAPPPART